MGAREEWNRLKLVVKSQSYPTKSTVELWSLISLYHREDFPNLLTLAELALCHPVHTSDCERSFSAQNVIMTPLRSRMTAEHCDELMRIMIMGGKREDHDFTESLRIWHCQKIRKINIRD